jgi:Uri superfamily endonuclease
VKTVNKILTSSSGKADAGIYQIFIELRKNCFITIGKLGKFHFTSGWYIYTGKAARGLSHRLRRHLRKDKALHWHIDWLLSCGEASIIRIMTFPLSTGECRLNLRTMRELNATVPAHGFGASDCHKACPAHLLYLGKDNRTNRVPPDALLYYEAL